MKKLTLFQLLGPVALFSAIFAAEVAALGLERFPSSEWLWYLNLKWFGMFQQSHYIVKAFLGGEYEQLFCIALPLIVCACLGVVFKRSLLLAIASNLSFMYMLFVLLAWSGTKSPIQASLSAQFPVSSNSEVIVLVALVALCLISTVVSHFAFIQKACAKSQ